MTGGPDVSTAPTSATNSTNTPVAASTRSRIGE
jgi:hypothetical protein